MKHTTRYYVAPCDNCGSLEGPPRDRTWEVCDRTRPIVEGKTVVGHASVYSADSRKVARAECAIMNGNANLDRLNAAHLAALRADEIPGGAS